MLQTDLHEYVGSPALKSFPHSWGGLFKFFIFSKPCDGFSPHSKYSMGSRISFLNFSSARKVLRVGVAWISKHGKTCLPKCFMSKECNLSAASALSASTILIHCRPRAEKSDDFEQSATSSISASLISFGWKAKEKLQIYLWTSFMLCAVIGPAEKSHKKKQQMMIPIWRRGRATWSLGYFCCWWPGSNIYIMTSW